MALHTRLLWIIALLALAFGCKPEDTAGGSVEENEVLAGTLYLPDGTPAAGATVRVYTVDHVPGTKSIAKQEAGRELVFSAQTDEKGRYSIDSLPRGEYNLLGQDNNLVSYRDSVFIWGQPKGLGSDTLRAPGSLTGWVKLQPNHDPRTVTVQVLGTNTFVNAGADGKFVLEGLAAGQYSLQVLTTEPQYTPLAASAKIHSGASDTLPDTLRLVYTGIPVVTGLKVSYDTLSGVARVSWNGVAYPQLQGYQVFRDKPEDLLLKATPIGMTSDTFYLDTLFVPDSISGRGPNNGAADSTYLKYRYRVKVVNKSEQTGLPYGYAELTAPSPYFVRTLMQFEGFDLTSGQGLSGDWVVRSKDSIRVNLSFRNPGRRVKRIEWKKDGEDGAVKISEFDPPLTQGSESYMESVREVAGEASATETFRVRSWDETGTSSTGTFSVTVVEKIPPITGLKIAYDTANGVARLSWDPRPEAYISGYSVFRSDAPSEAPIPLATVVDTFYLDALFHGDGEQSGIIQNYAYSVAAVSKSNKVGSRSESQSLTAPSPFYVRTALSSGAVNLSAPGTPKSTTATVRDTIRIDVAFKNPSRRVQRVQILSRDSHAAPLAEVQLAPSSKEGVASLKYVTGNSLGPDSVLIQALDDGGESAQSILVLNVIQDLPVAVPGADTLVSRGKLVRLHGAGKDGFGRIAKWEWDIGATGSFKETSGPDTSFLAPSSFDRIPCVLRVTDDDGNIASAQLTVTVGVTWKQVPVSLNAQFLGHLIGHQSVAFNDQIWNLGGMDGEPVGRFHPLNSVSQDGMTWSNMDSVQVFGNRCDHAAIVYKNKLWVMGGRALVPGPIGGFGYRSIQDIWSSSDGRTWDLVTAGNFPGENGFAVVVFQNKLWSIGGLTDLHEPIGVWSSDDGVTWTQASGTSPLPTVQGHTALVYAGKLWVIGGNNENWERRGEVWNSDDGINWNKVAYKAPFGTIAGHRSLVFADRMWVIGGMDFFHLPADGDFSGVYSNKSFARKIWYSSNGVSWQEVPLPDATFPFHSFSVLEYQNKMWVTFGRIEHTQFSEKIWQAE